MALFSLAEVYRRELAKQEGTSEANTLSRARSLRTNLINRLVVMISEEVNIHSIGLSVAALDMYQKWRATRDHEESRQHLLLFYSRLLTSEKCRIIRDYKTIFNLPPYYLPGSQWGRLVTLHKKLLKEQGPELYKLNYKQEVSSVDT
jgi:hypothetical protein